MLLRCVPCPHLYMPSLEAVVYAWMSEPGRIPDSLYLSMLSWLYQGMGPIPFGLAWQRWANRVLPLNQPGQAAQQRMEALRYCNIALAAP